MDIFDNGTQGAQAVVNRNDDPPGGAGTDPKLTGTGHDSPRMVPESDLIAVKQRYESRLETTEAELRTSRTETARLQASVTTLTESANKHATTAQELDKARADLTEAQKATGTITGRLVDLRREQIKILAPKLTDEALQKWATVEQLDLALEAIKSSGGPAPGSGQYTTGGGSDTTPPASGRAKIRAGLEAGELSLN